MNKKKFKFFFNVITVLIIFQYICKTFFEKLTYSLSLSINFWKTVSSEREQTATDQKCLTDKFHYCHALVTSVLSDTSMKFDFICSILVVIE